jgi:hypothetical protein
VVVNKIVNGLVIQQFDTETRRFIGQEFIADDEVTFEDEHGERVKPFDENLAFEMKQPNWKRGRCAQLNCLEDR